MCTLVENYAHMDLAVIGKLDLDRAFLCSSSTRLAIRLLALGSFPTYKKMGFIFLQGNRTVIFQKMGIIIS